MYLKLDLIKKKKFKIGSPFATLVSFMNMFLVVKKRLKPITYLF